MKIHGAVVLAGCVALGLPACSEKSVADGGAPALAEAPPAPAATPTVPPPPPEHPLEVGSQDAKDDLYCAAVIYAENPDPPNALNPIDEALLRKAQMLGFALGESGINKLVTEKAVHATHGAVVSDAYADQVAKDAAAGKTRISLDDCNARAVALPPVQ